MAHVPAFPWLNSKAGELRDNTLLRIFQSLVPWHLTTCINCIFTGSEPHIHGAAFPAFPWLNSKAGGLRDNAFIPLFPELGAMAANYLYLLHIPWFRAAHALAWHMFQWFPWLNSTAGGLRDNAFIPYFPWPGTVVANILYLLHISWFRAAHALAWHMFQWFPWLDVRLVD